MNTMSSTTNEFLIGSGDQAAPAKTIIHVCEGFAYGAATSTIMLAKLMADRGHRVIVYYGLRQGTENIDLASHGNIEWRQLKGMGVARHLVNVFQLLSDLWKSPDAPNIVLHGQSSYGGMYSKVVGKITGARVIYSPRGLAYLREDMSKWQRRVFFWLEKVTAKAAQSVACGPTEERFLKELGGTTIGIYNGMKLPTVSYDNGGDYFLGVGRICYQKGFDIFKDIARANPSRRFVWAGNPDAAGNVMMSDIPDNIEMLGFVTSEEVLQLIADSRAVLLPSRWEGLSRFLLESIAVGRPIVTSDYPGNVDCLKPQGDGSFKNGFSCATVEEYTSAINALDSQELLERMQRESRKLAEDDYDIDRLNQKWVSLYLNT
jgi:glycosyltransferase involved in cell wall biosynthesis